MASRGVKNLPEPNFPSAEVAEPDRPNLPLPSHRMIRAMFPWTTCPTATDAPWVRPRIWHPIFTLVTSDWHHLPEKRADLADSAKPTTSSTRRLKRNLSWRRTSTDELPPSTEPEAALEAINQLRSTAYRLAAVLCHFSARRRPSAWTRLWAVQEALAASATPSRDKIHRSRSTSWPTIRRRLRDSFHSCRFWRPRSALSLTAATTSAMPSAPWWPFGSSTKKDRSASKRKRPLTSFFSAEPESPSGCGCGDVVSSRR